MEIILKLLGAVLTVGGGSALGFYFGNLESRRAADLLELKKALAVLKGEMEFARAALPECMANASHRTEGEMSAVFSRMSELLRAGRVPGVGRLWEKSFTECGRGLHFNADDYEQIFSFGRTLGYLDLNLQTHSIRILENYIEASVAALNETRGKSRKMFGSLGVLGGLLAVVIFL